MAPTPSLTFPALKTMLSARQYAPIYLLHGEQGYFIDEAVKLFEAIIPEEDRDFDSYTLYAPETDPAMVIDTARRYPMMSERQVVILKEAQSVPATYLKALLPYAEHPSPTTILVIASRGASIKQRELIAAIKSAKGVVFEAPALKEYQVPRAIADLVKDCGLSIEPKALSMLADYIGADLARVYNEIEKLRVILPAGAMITPEVIERNIGVSKDYNNFELVSAISNHDEERAMRIVEYFAANPKANPVFPTLGVLFRYFSNMLIVTYSRDKSPSALMSALGFRFEVQLNDITRGLRYYNAWHLIEIIREIRRCEAMGKGIDSRLDAHDLLRTLIYRILNPTGRLDLPT